MLKRGGRIAFFTIQPRPGLDPRRRRKANRVGPAGVAVPTSYESLLRSAGFRGIDAVDVTSEYHACQRRWIDAMARHEGPLRDSMGDEMYDQRVRDRGATLLAIDEGLLSRFVYSATRPG